MSERRQSVVGEVVSLVFLGLSVLLSYKWYKKMFKEPVNNKLVKYWETRLTKKHGRRIKLSHYEKLVVRDLVEPNAIDVSFKDIGGLSAVCDELKQALVVPLQFPLLFIASKLTRPPLGVLLHGPPGTGKTMVARAVAKESGANFLNLDVSTLFDKYVGESNKRLDAVFTLARRCAPTIIFVDEIDGLLGSRERASHDWQLQLQNQFLSLWDGMQDKGVGPYSVMVMGTTNRRGALDRAALRRLPRQIHIGLPDIRGRADILHCILKNENLESDVDLQAVARATPGMCGSDLQEVCQMAAMSRLNEFLREAGGQGAADATKGAKTRADIAARLPCMRTSDLLEAARRVAPVNGVAHHVHIVLDQLMGATPATGSGFGATPSQGAVFKVVG